MFKGIVHITGEHDTGKTLMALGNTHPKKTVFFHNDVKSPGIDPKEFGQYHDLVSKKLTYLQAKDYFLEAIDKIKPGQYDGIVMDTWTRIGDALVQWGKQHATQFRERETMAKGQIYKWGQEWKEGRWYEASVISQLAELVPYVCLTTHLKDHYVAGAKTGKEIPDCTETLDRVCNLRVWLRHNPDSGVPIALVLKRPSITEITDKGLVVVDYMPRRVYPYNRKSVWEAMEFYKNNLDVGFDEDEEPTPFELSILDGILTPDQKETWRANLNEQKRQEELESELGNQEFEQFKAKVLEMSGEGLATIYQSVKDEFGEGYDLGQIKEILNGQ